jgi:hypothetical protein
VDDADAFPPPGRVAGLHTDRVTEDELARMLREWADQFDPNRPAEARRLPDGDPLRSGSERRGRA